MRILSIATLTALTLGVVLAGSTAASAQANEQSTHKKVYGYQDEQTGVFHPSNHATPEATTAATTGTIEVVITISLKSAVPTGGSVLCGTDISATSTSISTGASTVYEETSYSVAKITGSTATCTVSTPYSWLIPAASSTVEDALTGAYTISILAAPSTTISEATIQGRSSTSDFLNATKIPATGTISKYTVAATL